ncbi:MAG: endonuclease MutS2 [Chloroflexi bacterium]|nr:endonuclease MutS2 [Chloroflexota bacterium]
MNKHSLQVLDFNQVLLQLASHTSTPLGKSLGLRLRPTSHEEEVKRRQQETSEARALLQSKSAPSLGGITDLTPHLKRARIGSTLTPQELLEVHHTVVSSRGVGRALSNQPTDYPLLAGKGKFLLQGPDPRELGIGRAISEGGEALDEASPALAGIRRDLRLHQGRLEKRLQEIVSSPQNREYLQDPIITQRGGRYVIPLRAEFKGRVPGLVHDRSQSGATLFVEPMEIVEENNQVREFQLAEEQEVERILGLLTQKVGAVSEIVENLLNTLAEIDLALAKGKYSLRLKGVEPTFLPFRKWPNHPGSTLIFKGARHPLLDPEKVVPIDLYLSEDYFILVITGPNTGGKTVTLKTAGLFALMAQAGLHLPAEEAELSTFSGVYADIGVEQSIEQNLSTFSSHLTQIIDILTRGGSHSLVLFDELGAGTDPQEGAALAQAILAHLRERKITALVATHYPALKVYAQLAPGVENASLEFDVETLRPTYHLSIGLPGRSQALAIATRLGLHPKIIEGAQGLLSPQEVEVEKYLEEIKAAQKGAEEARAQAQEEERRAAALEKEWREKTVALEKEWDEILNQARQKARVELATFRARLNALQGKSAAERKRILAELRKSIQPIPQQKAREHLLPGSARVGDEVWVRGLAQAGEVVAVLSQDEVEVKVGGFRVKARVEDLETGEQQPAATSALRIRTKAAPPTTLNLRGRKAEEALSLLDKYLDQAFVAGLDTVRILHGRGTGTLRRLVRQELSRHPLVASVQGAEEQEGGEGVTVVKLVARS